MFSVFMFMIVSMTMFTIFFTHTNPSLNNNIPPWGICHYKKSHLKKMNLYIHEVTYCTNGNR
ncbi:hypothetical protein GA8_14840 [Geobacillus sp. A8]|nr:hypothetical protein GA8_14840 [Geobacillus sp. A8]